MAAPDQPSRFILLPKDGGPMVPLTTAESAREYMDFHGGQDRFTVYVQTNALDAQPDA